MPSRGAPTWEKLTQASWVSPSADTDPRSDPKLTQTDPSSAGHLTHRYKARLTHRLRTPKGAGLGQVQHRSAAVWLESNHAAIWVESNGLQRFGDGMGRVGCLAKPRSVDRCIGSSDSGRHPARCPRLTRTRLAGLTRLS